MGVFGSEHQWQASWNKQDKEQLWRLTWMLHFKEFLLRELTVLTKHPLGLEYWCNPDSFLSLEVYFLFSNVAARISYLLVLSFGKPLTEQWIIVLINTLLSSYIWKRRGKVRNTWIFFSKCSIQKSWISLARFLTCSSKSLILASLYLLVLGIVWLPREYCGKVLIFFSLD